MSSQSEAISVKDAQIYHFSPVGGGRLRDLNGEGFLILITDAVIETPSDEQFSIRSPRRNLIT